MSSSSRRKKSFEAKQREFQNRNIFAGIVLAIAAGFAIWLMVAVLAGNTPDIYLSTNYINYTGTQKEIPFAVKSCEQIVSSFKSEVELLQSEKPLELDSNTSQLKLSKNVRDKDVLIVYFNGHLVPGKNAPVEYLPAGDYEGSERRGDFGTLLKNINDSRGKLKILLIDAGRYTRSPVFPARKLNDFQKPLAEAIAKNDYGLDDNFWIIVSHSKDEFSRVSTPMESSLFSKAVAASVEHFADEGGSDLSVLDFFLEIRKRTASWSRNPRGRATQTPILMYPSKGRMLDDGEIEGIESTFAENTEKFQWKVAYTPRPEEDSEGKKVEKDVAAKFNGARLGSEAAERLLEEYRYDSLPRETVGDLERFLELGESVGLGNNRKRIKEYAGQLSEEPDKSQGKFDVDPTKLKPKQTAVQKFRRALFGVTVLTRFQNELRHWEDREVKRYLDEFNSGLPKLNLIPDSELTESGNVPPEYARFTAAFDDFYKRNLPLIERVEARIEEAKKDDSRSTPTQAEMLGRMSGRYLPIIAAFEPGEMDDSTDKEKDNTNQGNTEDDPSFVLELTPNEGKERFEGDMNVLYNETTGAFGSHFESKNDTAIRFRLAAQGFEGVAAVENLNNFKVAVPNIKWAPVMPGVNFRLASGGKNAKVNPTDPEAIKIRVEAQAIGQVDLLIAPAGNHDTGRLQYSFFEDSAEKTRRVLFDELKESKFVDVWFSNRSFDGPNNTIPFKITATWNEGKKKEFKFDVTLSNDADLVLTASRKLGEGISKESLLRWARRDFSEEDSRPLMLKSLANIETGFDFSVQNRSSKVRNLSFELYSIRADECEVRPDRRNGFDELSGELAKIKPAQKMPDRFQLLGTTKSVAIPVKSDEIRLEFARAEPDKDDEESEQVFGLQEIRHCMLLVGTNADTGEKEWFRWIGFNPKMPADYSANDLSSDQNLLAPLNDIIAGIKLNKNELERQLRKSWPKKEPAARLDVVSPISGRKAKNQPALSFDRVFAEEGGELQPGKVSGTEQRILIMELFGVPGYRVLRQSNDGIVRFTERNLVGLRVETEDSGCVCYPTTWSLLNFDASGKDRQTIFIRSDSSIPGDREVEFEFLLPALNANALASGPDYLLSWNGKSTRLFPNSRKHFMQFGEDGGLSFKSEVSPHLLPEVSFGNIADESVLEVFQKGKDRPIGSWQFKTESFGDKPGLKLSKSQVTKGNLVDVKVTADISKIRFPIDLSSVRLLVNGKEIKQFFKNKFNKRNPNGIYEFNLADLPDSVEFGIDSHKIELSITDFFGETLSTTRTIRVEKPEKQKVIVHKVKKKVFKSVRLNFPRKVGVGNFNSLKIGDRVVPWSTGQQQGIVAARKNGHMSVFRLPQGKYSFTVTATFLNDAETHSETITFKKTVEVNKEGQIIELESSQ